MAKYMPSTSAAVVPLLSTPPLSSPPAAPDELHELQQLHLAEDGAAQQLETRLQLVQCQEHRLMQLRLTKKASSMEKAILGGGAGDAILANNPHINRDMLLVHTRAVLSEQTLKDERVLKEDLAEAFAEHVDEEMAAVKRRGRAGEEGKKGKEEEGTAPPLEEVLHEEQRRAVEALQGKIAQKRLNALGTQRRQYVVGSMHTGGPEEGRGEGDLGQNEPAAVETRHPELLQRYPLLSASFALRSQKKKEKEEKEEGQLRAARSPVQMHPGAAASLSPVPVPVARGMADASPGPDADTAEDDEV